MSKIFNAPKLIEIDLKRLRNSEEEWLFKRKKVDF